MREEIKGYALEHCIWRSERCRALTRETKREHLPGLRENQDTLVSQEHVNSVFEKGE